MAYTKAERAKRARAARNKRYYEKKRAEELAQRKQAEDNDVFEWFEDEPPTLKKTIADAFDTARAEADRRRKQAEEDARRQLESFNRRCIICNQPHASVNISGVDYCALHSQEARTIKPPRPGIPEPELPPIRRPDPLSFHTKGDPWKPSFWKEIDPQGAEISLSVSPRMALLSPTQLGPDPERVAQERAERAEQDWSDDVEERRRS